MAVKRKNEKGRDWVITAMTAAVVAVFAVTSAAAWYLLRDARKALLLDVSERTESLARASREAFSPKLDRFWLNFLVNEVSRSRLVRYVVISDAKGTIISHSLPEKIGEADGTAAGKAARKAQAPLQQEFKGADGLEYRYFSSPIMLGSKRLGTVAVAVNSVTVDAALEEAREKLLAIVAAAVLALGLLGIMLALVRKEQRAAKLKSDMVHTVSHEFNNALAAIEAGLFLLEEGESEPEDESRSRIYRALANSRKTLRLYVKNILNEARMESGRFSIEKTPLSLIELTEETIAAMSELIRQRNVSVSVNLPRNCRLLVSADREAMALVVANLVGNAVKYTPRDGSISVKVTPVADTLNMAVFSVEDTGPGISAVDLEKIKAGFYRTAEGRVVAEGFGLGLKISNEMLLLHGSRLEVRSERGKGSAFSFSLPILETDCKLEKKV